MSSLRALGAAMVLTLLPLLAGCGFQPVYGTMSESRREVTPALAAMDINAAADQQGLYLTNDLVDRMHPGGKSQTLLYTLNFNVASSERDLGIEKNAVASRSEYIIEVPFTVVDKASGKEIYKSKSRTVVSYDVLYDQYATTIADQTALNRGLDQVADDMTMRLTLFFRRACADHTIPCPGSPASSAPAAAPATPTNFPDALAPVGPAPEWPSSP